MSLVDLGKKLLEAARAGQDDEVRILMANGAPFTTDWVKTKKNTCLVVCVCTIYFVGTVHIAVKETTQTNGCCP